MPESETLPTVVETTPVILSLTDDAFEVAKQQRLALQKFVKEILVPDVDHGKFGGSKKDCLLKPGAEKLQKVFQLGTEYQSTKEQIDWKENFCYVAYKCRVFRLKDPTVTIAECEGSANNQEKSKLDRNGKARPLADTLNTIQKMAQKRAFVGAIIIATGASDFFTHDLDDVDLGDTRGNGNDTKKNDDPDGIDWARYAKPIGAMQKEGPSEAQMRRLHAIAKQKNWSDDAQKELLGAKFNYTGSRAHMPWYLYQDFTKYMDRHKCDFEAAPKDAVDEMEGRSDESL